MKKIAVYIALGLMASSCAFSPKSAVGSDGGEVTGVRGTAMGEPTPYGMVLVSRGSMKMGPNQNDSVWNIKADPNGMSVESFWMDEAEITNAKYKQFVFWVRDSIIRERLADPAYGGDEEYKIEEDKEGNPIKPYLNWKKPIPWRNPTEDEQRAIASVYRYNAITGVTELDPTQMNYRYEVFNLTEAAKRKNRLDPARRNYNTDVPVSDEMPMISKDTAYINDEGRIVRETITRQLSSDYDFLNTYIVNVYPDTTAWINDFESAYNEPYTRLYFSHPGYSDYPVVGVSWEQANVASESVDAAKATVCQMELPLWAAGPMPGENLTRQSRHCPRGKQKAAPPCRVWPIATGCSAWRMGGWTCPRRSDIHSGWSRQSLF